MEQGSTREPAAFHAFHRFHPTNSAVHPEANEGELGGTDVEIVECAALIADCVPACYLDAWAGRADLSERLPVLRAPSMETELSSGFEAKQVSRPP